MTTDSVLSARVLVVDDQAPNVRLLERLLEHWGYSNVTSTMKSSEVMDLCQRAEPDLVLLDLQMPPPDGFELLEQLRAWARDRAFLPVLVLTADITHDARERALALGATDFLNKPFEPTEARLRIANLLETRRLHLEARNQNEVLEQRVRERTRELDQARLETLERLAVAAEYRDDNTQQHAQRVGRTCALLAAQLGLAPAEVEIIHRAAPLHDVGKIGISDRVLLKPGKLTPEEFELMKTHTMMGAEILSGSSAPVLQLGEQIALTHHEHWDGKGYPAALAGEEIPLPGRLVAIADVFDALTHRRPYKEAWPVDAALAEIRLISGRHLDPLVVECFEALDHESLLAPVLAAERGARPLPSLLPDGAALTR